MENDNKTAHMALEYDAKVKATIPNYDFFHSETIDIVKAIESMPEKWLDTGCGTGNLVLSAQKSFKATEFILADPSNKMLDILKEKFSAAGHIKAEVLDPVPTQDIKLPDNTFDVITAIQSHHYLDADTRIAATVNCFRMLKPGGIYVTFENISPFTEKGVQIGLSRWKQFQISKGKDIEEAEKHVERFGKEYFPINIGEHLNLLRQIGFSVVEILWVSHMQAGFYAIKGLD